MSLICYAFWLLLNSGSGITWEIALTGIPVTLLVLYLTHLMFSWSLKKEKRLLLLLPRLLWYALWLTKEVLVADITTSKLVWSGKIDPVLFRMEHKLHRPGLISLLADSITLTPGTLTVETDKDELTVYALNEEMARGTVEGVMAEKVARLSPKHIGKVKTHKKGGRK